VATPGATSGVPAVSDHTTASGQTKRSRT
jgi:hypothetical protein